jgi:hypothetical protein
MINKCIYNHPYKHFAREGLKVVVALVRACGARQDGLWRLLMQAQILMKFEREVFMLVCEIFFSSSRVDVLGGSVAKKFSFLRDLS